METFSRDLRYGLRSLGRVPGFAVAAILALAVGIGANTAVFSLFDAVVWHAIPVHDFGNLVLVRECRFGRGTQVGVSAPDLFSWQKGSHSFAGLAGFEDRQFTRTGPTGPTPVDASVVTPNFFGVLGARPLHGRAFTAVESEPGRSHVAILSYHYWQSALGGKPSAVGASIELDHAAYTIVGVMPRGIEYPGGDIWVPLALSPAQAANRGNHSLDVLGRLKPGVSVEHGQAELETIAADIAATYPATNKNLSVRVRSLRTEINGGLAYGWSLMFAVGMGLVLLIACANVANLQLARGTTRQKEIALRMALGASRTRVAWLLLAESLLMALAGAALGLAIAAVGIHLMVTLPPAVSHQVIGWNRIGIDGSALAFTTLVAVLAGIAAGLLPALTRSKPALAETLKEGGRSSTPGQLRGWLQGALVVAQVALALVLLVATSLMMSGVSRLANQQDRYASPNVLDLHVLLPFMRYSTPQRVAFYRQALAKLSAIPGVRAAAVFSTAPLSAYGAAMKHFQVTGRSNPSVERSSALPLAATQSISPGFGSMLRIPLVAGRDFTAADGPAALPVAIVSRNLAERYWPGGHAIGHEIRFVDSGKPGPWLTIVGVAGNVLWDWTNRVPEYTVFVPYSQNPFAFSWFAVSGSAPDALAPEVRRAISAIDPELQRSGDISGIEMLRETIHESTWALRFIAWLMTALGFVAFLLAAIGVYSLMEYAVAQRTHEIGVRVALGADSGRVFALILRRSAWLVAVGVAIGLPLAYALTRLLGGLIFGVGATDPAAFGIAVVVLASVAFLATYFPARRAARIDPVETLHTE